MWFDATRMKGAASTCRYMREVSLCLMQKVKKKLAGLENRAYLCSVKNNNSTNN